MRILFMSVWAISSTTIPKSCRKKASQMDASVTVEANDTNKAIYENTSNKSVMVGPWENLLKVANSTLLVKSQFLNVFQILC